MKNRKKNFIAACLLLLVSVSASLAQTGSVRGFVYEKESGEPVIFTNVVLEGTTYGIATDVNGYYNITKLPTGDYTLRVSYIGFDTVRVNIKVGNGQIVNQNAYLKKQDIRLGTVVISQEALKKTTEVDVAVETITPKQIKHIPTIGGEPDIAQYLQILPGVVFTGDQGGQLYIRGGTPIQNVVLLDGMVVYNPFHSIGLFSVFDTDILRNVDVYTGGFPADYGGRISSVMDITTRDGNKSNISGKVSAGTFNSKALIEGPIVKSKTENGGSSSFIFSAKNSYLKESSKLLYTYIDTGGLPYNFTDLYGKVSLNSSNGSKLNLFGFNFRDKVNYQFVSDLDWKASGFGSNFILIPGASPTLISGHVSYSDYGISLAEADAKPRTSEINGFNLGLNFTYYPGKDEIKYGVDVLGFKTDFNFTNSVGRKIEQQQNTTELAGFVRYKIAREKFLLEPSFRAHYYASLSTFSPEPRLGGKYMVSDKLRLKFAGGFYSQNLISATSDRDVVNLFYGFLSGPDNLQKTFDGKDVKHNLQKARHLIAGFEYDLGEHLDLNVEGYVKDFNQLTNLNRNKVFDDDGDNADKPDALKKDFIIERGKAYGVDFLVKYDFKRMYIWAVYSLGKVTRHDDVQSYSPHFDRRHNVNLVASYTFGKKLNYEANARWNLGSGFPFTQTGGFFPKQNFQDGINTDYVSSNEELGIYYGELNGGRLPYYHRLDVTVKRKFYIGERAEMEMILGVTNAYNRENIFYFDRVRYERVNQLPFMPSFGLNMSF
ncbi:MAG: TonB-dependent receptor [Flavobacteriales bacterium]|nr:TonB-dependent receptor [Flavobacteriales bacterium]MCB9447603.1 TonB-dependent receptor [Flavobacteriales bacterium]